MRESKIEGNTKLYAKRNGIEWIKLNGQGNRGKPDNLFFMPDRVFFIEFKAPGEDLEPLQKWWKKKLENKGFKVYVVDSKEKGRQVIDHEAEKYKKRSGKTVSKASKT